VDSATGTLVVRRPPRRRHEVLGPYRIEVNGTPRGLLEDGQTLMWELPTDTYRVQARIGRASSAPINVEVSEGSTVWLAAQRQPWRRWLARGVRKTGYLALHEVHATGRWAPAVSDGTDLTGLSEREAAEAVESAPISMADDVAAIRWLNQMQHSRVAPASWFSALGVTGAGGLVLAADYVVSLPAPLFVAAAAAFLGGLAWFGVLGFVEARRSGSGYWRALWNALRSFLRALWHLFP
jgi:hypothetical protein